MSYSVKVKCKNCVHFKATEHSVVLSYIEGQKTSIDMPDGLNFDINKMILAQGNGRRIKMCHHPECFSDGLVNKKEKFNEYKNRIAGQAQFNNKGYGYCKLYKRDFWKLWAPHIAAFETNEEIYIEERSV